MGIIDEMRCSGVQARLRPEEDEWILMAQMDPARQGMGLSFLLVSNAHSSSHQMEHSSSVGNKLPRQYLSMSSTGIDDAPDREIPSAGKVPRRTRDVAGKGPLDMWGEASDLFPLVFESVPPHNQSSGSSKWPPKNPALPRGHLTAS